MKLISKINIVLILSALCLACSSSPMQKGNSAEYQKAKAKQAQKELASEISKQ